MSLDVEKGLHDFPHGLAQCMHPQRGYIAAGPRLERWGLALGFGAEGVGSGSRFAVDKGVGVRSDVPCRGFGVWGFRLGRGGQGGVSGFRVQGSCEVSRSAESRKLEPTKDMLMVTSGCPSAKLGFWEVEGLEFRI